MDTTLSLALCSADPGHVAHAAPVALAFEGGAAPEWVRVIPVGALEAADGRRWRLDDPERVIADSLAGVSERVIPIDRDHALDAGKGDAPAMGWIEALEVRDGWIMGRVSWTEEGERLVRGRAYRFVSPAFLHTRKITAKNPDGGRVTRVTTLSLVNRPAFSRQPALAQQQKEASEMEFWKALAVALGLPEDTEAEALGEKALAAIEAGKAAAETVKPVLAAAGLDGELDDAKATALCAKLKAPAGQPDPKAYVTRDAFDAVQTALASLQSQLGEDKALAAVEAAKKAGKLTPAQEEWGLALAKSDLGEFERWEKTAPVIAPGGRVVPSAPPGKGAGDRLTDEERAVCRLTGVSEEKFLATKKEQAA